MAEGARIVIRVEGAGEARAELARAAAKADRPRDLFDAIGEALTVSTQARFERGETPEGSPWPISIRARMQGGRTLIDTGRLMRSLTHIASDRSVEVGSNAIYAAIHQFGGTIVPVGARALAFEIGGHTVFARKAEIPARPFLGLDAADEAKIAAIAADWLGAENTGA